MMRCAILREARTSATSPKVPPVTAESPEKALLMRSFAQRAPMKFSSTVTVPMHSSSFLISFTRVPPRYAPSEKVSASASLVSSETPGPCRVAPHATAQP